MCISNMTLIDALAGMLVPSCALLSLWRPFEGLSVRSFCWEAALFSFCCQRAGSPSSLCMDGALGMLSFSGETQTTC